MFALVFYGICEFFNAFATDLKQSFEKLDNKIQKFAGGQMLYSDYVEIKTTIYEIIQFHADVLQLCVQFDC